MRVSRFGLLDIGRLAIRTMDERHRSIPIKKLEGQA
jgi:hypothetical protein